MDILEAQFLYMVMVSSFCSLLIGIISVELKKPIILLFNVIFGAFTGSIIGGFYLGVSGGLGGFNDNILTISPWLYGSLSGFLGPGILKVQSPRFFKSVSLPVKYKTVSNLIWITFLISGVLSLAVVFVSPFANTIPGSVSDVIQPSYASSLSTQLRPASEVFSPEKLSELSMISPLGYASPYDFDIDYYKSAGFLETEPKPGDVLNFHAVITVNEGSISWVKPAVQIVIWGDEDNNNLIDDNEKLAIGSYIWPIGEFKDVTTFRPIAIWKYTGSGNYRESDASYSPYMIDNLAPGFLGKPHMGGPYSRNEDSVQFNYAPDGWISPCDCFTCFWNDTNGNNIFDNEDETTGYEAVDSWFTKSSGEYAEVYGSLLVTKEMSPDYVWKIRTYIYDWSLPKDERQIDYSDMHFVVIEENNSDGKVKTEWIVALSLFGVGTMITAVFIPSKWRI